MINIRSVLLGIVVLISGPVWALYTIALVVAAFQLNVKNIIVSLIVAALSFLVLRWACLRLVRKNPVPTTIFINGQRFDVLPRKITIGDYTRESDLSSDFVNGDGTR